MKLASLRVARRSVLVGIVALLAAVFVSALYASGMLNQLERQSVDQRFTWRGDRSPGTDIVIVGIDQTTLQQLGVRPPLPRKYYAQAIDRLRAASPRVIGVDLQFIGRTDRDNDDALLAAIARNGPVVLATHDGPQGPITVPADVPNAVGAEPASAAIDKDPDGVLRRMLYAPVHLETLAVRVAEMFRNQAVDYSEFPHNHAWIDFRGPPGTFPHYSFSDVLGDKVPASAFTDKAVLIGTTDPTGEDLFVTSMSSTPMPGVEVHANALWTILAGLPLRPAGAVTDLVLILILIAIPAAIATRKPGLFVLAGAAGSAILYLAAAQLAFNAGWIVAVTAPITGLVISTAGMIGADAYLERRQRAALEQTLGDLLPPQKPPAFFISYRRSQDRWQARDIRKELAERYGDAAVFMDTASINYGDTFPDRITSAIRGCSVMLVLIGPDWLEPTDTGTRRIDDPNDWVRREIEAGLHRQEALVIPALLDGATAPTEAELPESISQLATRHAITIAGDNLPADIDNLLNSIQRGQRTTAQSGVATSPADT